MQFLNDTFTDAATTVLTSHTGETGATWTKHGDASYSARTPPAIDSANRLRHTDALDVLCYASGSPTVADVFCPCIIKCYSLPGSLQIIAPTLRIDTASATWYTFWFQASGSSGTIQIYKYTGNAGSGVAVGSPYNFTLTAGQSYTMTVSAVGPTLRVLLDGVERVNVQDAGITAAGKVGILTYGSLADGTGIVADSIAATDAYALTHVTTGGVDLTILDPPSYDGSTPTGVVFLHHGAGGDRDFWLNNTWMSGFRSRLLQDGYILAGASSGDTWGNDTALAKYGTAHAYVIANRNVSGIINNGQSMGGVTALRAMRDAATFQKVKGFAGTYPVCDLLSIYDDIDTYDAQILTAWGAADRPALVTAISGKNPVDLSAAGFPNKRYIFWSSASDTVVLKSHNTDPMRTVLSGTTTRENTLVTTSGDHGDQSNFDAAAQARLSQFVADSLADPSGPAPALSVSPTSVEKGSTANILTLTGTATAWTPGTPGSPTFTASAGTITAQTITSGSAATLTYNAPATVVTVTITDPANSTTDTVDVVDTTAPAAPTGLGTGTPTAYNFTLPWTASASGDVVSYRVKKNGSVIATPSGTTQAITGAVDGDVFTVEAFDGVNYSAAASVTFHPPTGTGGTAPSTITVNGPDGNPVPNAEVFIALQKGTTNSSGQCVLNVVDGATNWVSISFPDNETGRIGDPFTAVAD